MFLASDDLKKGTPMLFTSKRAIRLCVFVLLLIGLVSHMLASRAATGLLANNPPRVVNLQSFSSPHSSTRSNIVSDKHKQCANDVLNNLPLRFEQNAGQADQQLKFFCRNNRYNLGFAAHHTTINFTSSNVPRQSATLKMKFIDSNPASNLKGFEELTTKSNYFTGKNPKDWHTNIANFASLKYENLYKGVDAIFYGNEQNVEYDFVVAPQADAKAIQFAFEGAQSFYINEQGDLILQTSAGEIRQHKPVAYQQINGQRKEIVCQYKRLSHKSNINFRTRKEKRFSELRTSVIGFAVGVYDKSLPLVIDPVLDFSTHFGTSIGSSVFNTIDATIDQEGNIYVVGNLTLDPIPQSVAPAQNVANRNSIFVAKLDSANKSLLYTTYLSSDLEIDRNSTYFGAGVVADIQGNAYVTGYTTASAFPTTQGAFQTSLKGAENAFVTKLNREGNALIYSTYLGAADTIQGSGGLSCAFGPPCSTKSFAIDIDLFGNAYITGQTTVRNFPTTSNAFKPNKSGDACFTTGGDAIFVFPCSEAFVSKLNASGTGLVYSTFLGGNGNDAAKDIAVDDSGNAYIVGTTEAHDFPTKDALYPNFIGGKNDAFVTKLNSEGSALVYSTYFGGQNDDMGKSIAIDSTGNAYICGDTFSMDLPVTANALQSESGNAPFFKSTDSGLHWQVFRKGLNNNLAIHLLALDPNIPSTIYAGTNTGVFKSTDSGNSWNNPLPVSFRKILAFAPQNPSVVFALNAGGFPPDSLVGSTDGGNTWRFINFPLVQNNNIRSIIQLAVDPTNVSTFYVTAKNSVFGNSPVLKTTDGGVTWQTTNKGLSGNTSFISIDPKNPSTLYAQDTDLFRSANGGKKWKLTDIAGIAFSDVSFDSANSSIVYASGNGLFKSTNSGESWNEIDNNLFNIQKLLVDPANSSTMYAISSGKIYKSTDGGKVWKDVNPNSNASVISLAIDPKTPSTLYAGTNDTGTDAFVVKLNAQGSALTYCTYLGGYNSDSSASIAVDSSFNAYITGTTNSDDFPTYNAFQPDKRDAGNAFGANDAFVVKLNPSATEAIYSSYLGGNQSDFGNSIIPDKFGRVYMIGSTRSDNFPTIDSFQPFHNSGDVFISRLIDVDVAPPAPLVSSLMPNSGSTAGQTGITINGANFLPGATVSIGGVLAKEVVVVNGNTIHAKTDAAFSAGIKKVFVVNPDGQSGVLINGFSYLLTPKILGASINNNRLQVQGIGFSGYGFDKGAVLLIDDKPVATLNDRVFPQSNLISKKALKKIPFGQTVQLQVRNSNGLLSDIFSFRRS
jgi:photosystem II stability/assembly factor-like uncharacterized protein